MLYLIDRPSADQALCRRVYPSRARIRDELVLEALRPIAVLQIGCPGEVLDQGDWSDAVSSAGSLQEARGLIVQHEFDAIVLGSHLADAWPTTAYEELATLAGSTPVLVQADQVEPMLGIKQRHSREQDMIVAKVKPSLLTRLMVAAILRRRALAEEPGTRIG